jgi:hypothetical protein
MKNQQLISMIFILVLVLAACGPSSGELEATTTAIAANVFSTQTAEAPTATITPTITPTSTSKPTQTTTPTPSRTPTITVEPTADYSWAKLTLDDLPPGFTEIPADDFIAAMGELGDESLDFEDGFMFLDLERVHILMGFTVLIDSSRDQVGFDLLVSQPDIMAQLFISGLEEEEGDEILSQDAIADTEGLGDAANYFVIVVDLDGTPMLMDVLIFRQGSVGLILMLIHEDSDVPVVDVVELGSLVASRGQS